MMQKMVMSFGFHRTAPLLEVHMAHKAIFGHLDSHILRKIQTLTDKYSDIAWASFIESGDSFRLWLLFFEGDSSYISLIYIPKSIYFIPGCLPYTYINTTLHPESMDGVDFGCKQACE